MVPSSSIQEDNLHLLAPFQEKIEGFYSMKIYGHLQFEFVKLYFLVTQLLLAEHNSCSLYCVCVCVNQNLDTPFLLKWHRY